MFENEIKYYKGKPIRKLGVETKSGLETFFNFGLKFETVLLVFAHKDTN